VKRSFASSTCSTRPDRHVRLDRQYARFRKGPAGRGITLSRDANRPLEPVLEQVVDELRPASNLGIETDFAITEPVNCDRSRMGQLVST
jgi:hypothetical protein